MPMAGRISMRPLVSRMRSAAGGGLPTVSHFALSIWLSLKLSTSVCAFAIMLLLPGLVSVPPPMCGGAPRPVALPAEA
jgi:hypothetical protein